MIYIILIILIVIFRFLNTIKRFIYYHPTKTIKKYPSQKYNEFNVLTNDNCLLNCWLVYSRIPSDKYILFSHGNAGNISNRHNIISLFTSLGYNFIIYDYRGFGKSTGIPSEKGLYTDILAIWNYMIDKLQIKPNNIILYGNSIGTCPTSYLNSYLKKNNIQHYCTVLQCPFYSFRNIAFDLVPKILCVLCLFVNEFKTHIFLENNTSPILFIHSSNDNLINPNQSKRLYHEQVNKNNLTDYILVDGDHNNPELNQYFIDRFMIFIDKIK